ncbi:PREDICTED: protein FAM184A-like [Polistes canadensis]|uniref:protein FAM184A-like n=1 Tax=Polistes canadensis TaxID=91411 RepID=UPI000718D585|nr:PREDICTED: protein FAM184A-like [Polistes canadensis]
MENKYLHKELLEYQEMNESLHTNIRQLTSEIIVLKAKLSEMQKVKNVLESTHKENVQQYKNKVAEQFSKLKFQLHEAECKNESLNNNLLTMSQELDKIIHDKEEEINAIKKQCVDKLESMHQQYEVFLKVKDLEINTQIDSIRQKDLELLKKDEEGNKRIELLTNKIKEMEIKLEIETKDENKLRAMLTDQNAIMRQEFDKMRSEIELVSQNQNENLVSKTIMLKKTILKLKKSKDKLVYDYETKINHILKV